MERRIAEEFRMGSKDLEPEATFYEEEDNIEKEGHSQDEEMGIEDENREDGEHSIMGDEDAAIFEGGGGHME